MKHATAGRLPAASDVSETSVESSPEDLTRIGDMARLHGVTLRALRFYEDKGLINPVRQGTTRLYTGRDRARLKLILLGRKVGFSLREVKMMLDLYDPSGSNMKQYRVALEKSERQLGKLERQRKALDEAIGDMNGLISSIRRRLDNRTAANAR